MGEAVIFEFPYNLFIKQRLEFVLICQDELESLILRIAEYQTAKLKEDWQNKVTQAIEEKKTPPTEPKEYWFRLSHAQIIARLYRYDTAKVGRNHPLGISKGTLRKALHSLVDKGFLFQKAKPGDEFGPTQYALNRPVIQAEMKLLPSDPFSIFWGGDTIFETPPVTNNETGEIQTLEVPLTKYGTPQLQNMELDKDSNQDISLEIEDKDTHITSTPDLPPSETPVSLSAPAQVENENDSQGDARPATVGDTPTPPPSKNTVKGLVPLVMPPDDAPWCAETIVQIHEARKGRRYPNGAKRKSDRERDIALEYAALIVKDMPDITRENYIKAIDRLETRKESWWLDSGPGPATPKHMYEKDRVHAMLDELARLAKQSPPSNEKKTSTPRSNSRLVDESTQDYETVNPQEQARRERNKDITPEMLKARIAALSQGSQNAQVNQKVKVS